MKLRARELLVLFLVGAAASLVGDHSHVVTGTTEYLTDAVPFVWSSPIWFPVMVGAATVALAELRLRLPEPRTTVIARQGLAESPRFSVPTSRQHWCTVRHPYPVLLSSSRWQ